MRFEFPTSAFLLFRSALLLGAASVLLPVSFAQTAQAVNIPLRTGRSRR